MTDDTTGGRPELQAIRDAQRAIGDAQAEYVLAIERAHAAGVPITEIAAAAGRSRPAIYRIVSGGDSLMPPRGEWVRILDDGLTQMLEYLDDPATLRHVGGALTSRDIRVKARCAVSASQNLSPRWRDGGERSRDIIEAVDLGAHLLKMGVS